MRVLKFGGSSLATAERFRQVANIIKDQSQASQVAVVVSAPQGVTNHLVAMAENISDENKLKSDLQHHVNKVEILTQPAHFPLSQYRKDLRLWV